MWLDLFRKRPKEKGIVALDIGTEVMKAMLFTIEGRTNASGEIIGKKAIIRGAGKVRQRMEEIQGGVIADLGSVIHHCKEAIRIATEESGLQAKELVMGLAGEFVKGMTCTLNHPREEGDSKINLAELRNIVHKLEWKAFAESRKTLSEETGHPEIDLKLIQSAIIEIRVDGYRVTNPIGFQGKEVEMSIFNAFTPIGHLEAIHGIAEGLHMDLLGVVAEPYALSRSLHGGDEANPSAIFIDIGGTGTDIAVLSNGSLLGSKTFGIGGRSFTKRIALELNIALDEAEKLKIAYSEDRLEQKSKKILNDLLENDVELWLQAVLLALSEFKNISVFPPKIILCGGGAHLAEIKEALNSEKWYKKLPFQTAPQAVFFQNNEIGDVVDETKKIKDIQDITPLSLANAALELTGEETIIQKALKKVIGIMQV